MNKFIALIKNEFIKLFMKTSTKIIVILLVLFSIGLCLLVNHNNTASYYYVNSEDSYRQNIEWAKSEKYEGWEETVEMYQFLLDNDIDFEDWRNNEVYNIFYQKSDFVADINIIPEEKIAAAKKCLADNDWKGYYTALLDIYKSIAGADDESFELSNWKYIYSLENDISPIEKGWKYEVVELLHYKKIQMHALETGLSYSGEEKAEHEELKNDIAIYEYRLENNISRDTSDLEEYFLGSTTTDVWSLLYICAEMIPFLVGVLFIIIASGIVASEFSGGTIKFLLINPVKRWKILVSKYIVTLIVGFIFLAILFLTVFIFGGIITGFENINAVMLTCQDETVTSMPAVFRLIQIYLLGFVNLVVMATLAFSISSFLRSSTLATGVSLFALIGGSIINQILSELLHADWGRYLIFANIDLLGLSKGNIMYEGQTIGFALCVIAVHMVIFLLTAWDGFTRREV